MKLNINPKEVLALHNLLHDCLAHHRQGEDDTEQNSDEVQLRQLYGRLRAIITASLTSQGTDMFELWEKTQNDKIAKLIEDLDTVKQDGAALAQSAPTPGEPVIMSAEDLEVLPDTYPRKGPPPPRMPRPGKHHGHRQ